MRKLKLQVQMSVDGHIGGPNGEMDFMTWNWDDALKDYVTSLTESIDCIVLGRKLAEGFIPYWASVAADPANPERLAGKTFSDTPKVVFSRTLTKSPWENTVVASGDLSTAISSLKKQDGKDIMVYGGASFVSSLIESGLIDEYQLFINPAAIGKGLPIFNLLDRALNLKLVKSTAFDCGIVLLHYETKEQLRGAKA